MIAADLASAAVLLGVVAAALAVRRARRDRPRLRHRGAGDRAGGVPASAADRLAVRGRRPRLLPAANGLLDATGRIARLLGPGLVALLVSAVPVIHFLTLDAVTFLASAAALLLIRQAAAIPLVRVHRAGREPTWSGVFVVIAQRNCHPLLGYYLAASGPLNGAWYAVYLLVSAADDHARRRRRGGRSGRLRSDPVRVWLRQSGLDRVARRQGFAGAAAIPDVVW